MVLASQDAAVDSRLAFVFDTILSLGWLALFCLELNLRDLGDLELALSDEVDSIHVRTVFRVDFLATPENFCLHVVLDLLNDVGSKLTEHAETPKKFDFFLQLLLLCSTDNHVVIASVKGCEGCIFATNDGRCAFFVFKKRSFSKRGASRKFLHSLEPRERNCFLVAGVNEQFKSAVDLRCATP